ncbi:MAG TPA: hypothetical protein VGM90_13205 [Kofleriaceae bacterium]|jgi:hypothetical protein
MRHILIGLVGILVAACDPAGPEASGTIFLAPGVSADGYSILETYWEPADGSQYPASLDRYDAPLAFPMPLHTGVGIGFSDSDKYRLTAWLTNEYSPIVGELPAGTPHATINIDIPECSNGCDAVDGFVVELAP